jgi:hypothetical protein
MVAAAGRKKWSSTVGGMGRHRAFAGMGLAPKLISVEREGPWWVVRMQHMAPEDGWLPLSAFLAPRELPGGGGGGGGGGSMAASLHALATGLSETQLQRLVARIEDLLRKAHALPPLPPSGQAVGEASGAPFGRGFVHGDVRPPNVLLKLPLDLPAVAELAELNVESLPIVFVDFDWAGTEGEVRFPPLLNPRVPWPEGVEGGGFIRKEHDLKLLHATTRRKEATGGVRALPWQVDLHSSLADDLRAVLKV